MGGQNRQIIFFVDNCAAHAKDLELEELES
jgi:hypothetical protein